MNIADLNYREKTFAENSKHSPKLIRGGIDISAFAFAFAQGRDVAITQTFTTATAVAMGFGGTSK